ncbi:2-phospho-L-lactate guanylyltransferase [Jatrophihabitans sp.]|uniref:2-phospho-L-lactate guanylyltransferase n=1 Tax=Jatrophihabitans sp. TaxID=1932789 RepID=UPI0030C6E815|nr:CofC, 2-Phospho-l-lactate Guanylyltransferase [Jatrophihabitans sp.]
MGNREAATLRWTVLVPLKALPSAKSRLAATLDPVAHVELVEAIRADTLAAAAGAPAVARVVVVTDVPGDFDAALTVVQTEPGLNAGLAEAAREIASRWPADGIAALVGDLPALRPAELDAALRAAAAHPRAFVADASGTGTTLLAVTPGTALEPRFGLGSAARHAAAATALAAGESLRADVDTVAELETARLLGVGPRSSEVLARWARL